MISDPRRRKKKQHLPLYNGETMMERVKTFKCCRTTDLWTSLLITAGHLHNQGYQERSQHHQRQHTPTTLPFHTPTIRQTGAYGKHLEFWILNMFLICSGKTSGVKHVSQVKILNEITWIKWTKYKKSDRMEIMTSWNQHLGLLWSVRKNRLRMKSCKYPHMTIRRLWAADHQLM